MAAMLGGVCLAPGLALAADAAPEYPVIPGVQVLPPGQSLTVTESVSGEGQGEISAGASLTIAEGVDVRISNSTAINNGDVTIAGSFHFYNSDLVNNANVTVTSSGNLELGEKLTNNGALLIAGTAGQRNSPDSGHAPDEVRLFNNGTVQVAATYIEGNNPYSYYGGLRLFSKHQLEALLQGTLIIGHTTPQELMVGSMLNLTAPNVPLIDLNTSDFTTPDKIEPGKIVMADMGVLYFSNTTVRLNGDRLTLGPKNFDPAAGFASINVNGANLSRNASLCTDFLELNPQSGNTFTLESGRILINGVNEKPYISINQGEGTLHINGGQVQLGQSTTGVHNGEVRGSIRVGSENLQEGDYYDSTLDISSGDWTISGDLEVEKSGSLRVGRSRDVQTGKALAANLIVNGSFLMNGGSFRGINIGAFKTDRLVGNEDFILDIGGDVSGNLQAREVQLNGGQINFDPPFIADGDTSNASLGGLEFASSNVDGRINVGRNSMVTLGSADPEWLRTQIGEYQGKTGNLWGKDMTAALAVRSPQTLAPNGGLNVDGAWTSGGAPATVNKAIFAANSLFVVDGAGVGEAAALDGNGTATLEVKPGAKLFVTDGAVGDSIIITDNFAASDVSEEGWAANTTSPLLEAKCGLDGQGRFVVGLAEGENPAIAFPLLVSELDAVLDAARRQGLDTDSDSAGVRFISRAVDNRFLGAKDADLAAVTIESAARMAVVGAVPQMTLAANNAAGAAITQRTSMAQPGGIIRSVDASGNYIMESKERFARQFALWVMPLYQSTNGFGLEAGNLNYDFSGALGGVALGGDYTFENMLRVGLAFNIGGGYARGGGDMNTTKNNMSFWGLGAYAGWSMDNFGLSADINYTSTYNRLKQDLPEQMRMKELKSDVTAWAISTGLRAEYKLETDYLDIVPHAGFRYINLTTDSYDINSNGTVIDGDSFTQNIWTFPFGLSFSKSIELENGWHFKPLVDFVVTPATGDIKAKSKIHFSGIGQEAELDTKTMDYITYGGTAGIEFGKETVSIGVNYNGQYGAKTSTHGIFGTFRVEF